MPNTYSEYRYILGTRGKKPLICVGINPSTAAPDALDPTLQSAQRIALANGYDSFLMFNVYAQRATSPDDMERTLNEELHRENMAAFDIMVVMKEQEGRLDTLDFCNSLGITREQFDKRMETIKDRSKNPGYSRYTQQLFMSQLSDKDFSVFQEKMFRFPGFYVQKRSVREYTLKAYQPTPPMPDISRLTRKAVL